MICIYTDVTVESLALHAVKNVTVLITDAASEHGRTANQHSHKCSDKSTT